jgi:hypothetical protein
MVVAHDLETTDYSFNSVRGQRMDVHVIRWREPASSHLILVQKHYVALSEGDAAPFLEPVVGTPGKVCYRVPGEEFG